MPDCALISLEEVRFGYFGDPPLFDGLNFSLHEDERIGLFGPNGSGKTTLLRLLMGLERPQAGRLLLETSPVVQRQDFYRLRRTVGFVLQNSDDQLFSPTVLEDVAFGPLNLGMTRQDARDRAMETLERLGIADLAEKPIHRLSGGEKKMVALSSVLSMRPRALLLDEPTNFLDEAYRENFITLLQRESLALVVVSHDREFLRRTASAFLTIRHGTLTRVGL